MDGGAALTKGFLMTKENAISKVHYSVLDADIRMTVDENQKIWFVASDIAKVLEYRDATALVRGLDDDEKGTQIVCTLGGDQTMSVITESGLYHVLLNAKTDRAKPFRRWVTEEVLPQIRKTGSYVPQKVNAAPTAKQQRTDLAEALDVAERLAKTFSRGVQQAYLLEQDQAYFDDTSRHLLPKLAIHEATVELEKAHITYDVSENTLMAARVPVADFPTVNVGELAKSYKNKRITTTLINKWLCDDGFQTKISKRKYAKTKRSKDIAVEKLAMTGDTAGRKYINGWRKTNELLSVLNKHVDEFLGS